MFFQKNIFEDLGLGRRLRISIPTCYITSSFFTLTSTFYLPTYYYLHRPCALTACLSYHYTYLSIVFSLLEKPYTHSLTCKTQKEEKRRRRSERSEDQLTSTFSRSAIEHSICWLHHRATSIDVVDSGDQNIGEDWGEASSVKANSTVCPPDLADYIIGPSGRSEGQLNAVSSRPAIELQYADYIIGLHR